MPLAELSCITPDDDEMAASATVAKTNESSDDGIISSESSEDEPVVTMSSRRKSIIISESEGSNSEGESVLSSPRKNKGRKRQSFSKQKAGGKGKAPMKETTARPASKRPRRDGQ